jgi:hypothetical protein
MSETTVDVVRRVLDRHRRHIERSPGVGAAQQRYALATLDDVEAELRGALGTTPDMAPCGQCTHAVAYHSGENPGCMFCECGQLHEDAPSSPDTDTREEER